MGAVTIHRIVLAAVSGGVLQRCRLELTFRPIVRIRLQVQKEADTKQGRKVKIRIKLHSNRIQLIQ
jgi:hypothetical protein